MKETLTPRSIRKNLSNGDLSKENAADLLISLIETSDNTKIRVESIKTLEEFNIQNQKIFKILENCLISDEDAAVRVSVANFIIHNFLDDALPALRWVIQHEKSPLVLKIIFEYIKDHEIPQVNVIKKDFLDWKERFSSKIGVVPQEAIFFLDLEVLFAREKKNYEINAFSYTHFRNLSDIKNEEPWLVINDKHVEILNFNYFKWKFIKDNPDIIDSLSKLQDLDIYLCSIKRYSPSSVVISSIPESIGSLSELKKLILRRNSLKKLPTTMKNLVLLKELDLSYNKLEEFPEILYSLDGLEKVNIKHNKVQNIPTSFSKNIEIIR
ncbi:MAG: HEAT repeat domain-containing protein [Candidatus Lokiarchaeota archaeon]|nr:HEAT repeat domain-containing protein [Candidatus Lokiarchaeota archaeon]